VATTPETTVHRALADPRRARILAELDGAAEPLDSSELGRRVGLHPNTVRWHLAILADAGLVRSRSAPRDRPGRPRRVYEPTERARSSSDERPPTGDAHRALATALVDVVAGQPGAGQAAERAGRAWGRAEAVRAGPTANPMARLASVLAAHGFAPAVEGREVAMHRCPFPDLARTSPEVVCGVHRGLVDGVLDGLGTGLAVAELEVFPRPGVCIAHLGEHDRRTW
jgi:predicted ArsR family transcriptional regulator